MHPERFESDRCPTEILTPAPNALIHCLLSCCSARGMHSALQGNWRQNLINAQQTFPAFQLQKKRCRAIL